VVPGTGVTIASSAPASAFSSELLPTLGWPAMTTCSPSRRRAPWRARQRRVDGGDQFVQAFAGARLFEEVDLLFREIERRLHQRAQLDDACRQRRDDAGEGAGQ
jgi:hypothetical protein